LVEHGGICSARIRLGQGFLCVQERFFLLEQFFLLLKELSLGGEASLFCIQLGRFTAGFHIYKCGHSASQGTGKRADHSGE
jgi:hypothetical protein